MDVYHKVLAKIFEAAGGKESQDVDFTELVKREGFFPNIADIKEYMSGESWITDAGKPQMVRLTHWGVSEAKKSARGKSGDTDRGAKTANRLLAETRELLHAVESFSGKRTADNFRPVEKKYRDLQELIDAARDNL